MPSTLGYLAGRITMLEIAYCRCSRHKVARRPVLTVQAGHFLPAFPPANPVGFFAGAISCGSFSSIDEPHARANKRDAVVGARIACRPTPAPPEGCQLPTQ